jgi:ABC-type transport system involved in multi-copper enzyme maturation permease subunit
MSYAGGLAVPAAVRTFGNEKEVYWREASSGASRLAYYLGKAIADIPYIAIMSLLFMSPMVIIAPWRAPMEGLYAYTFILMLFMTSLAYLLSGLTDRPENAALTGVIVAVLANLFGGFVPMIGSSGEWAYTHWAQRALVALELKEGRDMTQAQFNVLVDKEWENADYGQDLGILLGFSLALHVAAFTALALRRKDKQR